MIGINAMQTTAAWIDTAQISGTTLGTATLAPPTSLAVTQRCVADGAPTRHGAVSTASTVVGTTLTVDKPTSAVAGDVLLASFTGKGNYQMTQPTAPTGWDFVISTMDQGIGQIIYTRLVDASDPASYTWAGVMDEAVIGIAAYSGVYSVSPVNASAGLISSTTTPSITTTRKNTVLVAAFGANQNSAPNPQSGSSLWSVVSATGQTSMAANEETFLAPGSTGSRSASGMTSARKAAQLIALQPAARPYADITWTKSASTYATGQQYRLTVAGSPQSWQALAGPNVVTRTEGPLVPGTAYVAEVHATYQSWRSTAPSVAFNGRTCPQGT